MKITIIIGSKREYYIRRIKDSYYMHTDRMTLRMKYFRGKNTEYKSVLFKRNRDTLKKSIRLSTIDNLKTIVTYD